jgi:3-hydroxyacyl-[acyl-carrier-protein] dehydratase
MNNEIHELIPHREPFLFVDELTECTDTTATALRHVQASESFFQGHYPGNPLMPGVLLCEAVFQTAALFLAKSLKKQGMTGITNVPVLSKIKETRFKSPVRPDEHLRIEVTLLESIGHFHFLKGSIYVEKRLVLTTEFSLALVSKDKLGI